MTQPTQGSLDTAARMGERAADRYLDTGVWAPNPFGGKLDIIAKAFSAAMIERVGEALRPQ